MFDIGFTELLLIGIVALVVIGPERLPAVAKTAGQWIGKLQRFVTGVKSDLASELKSGDLEKLIGDQREQINELRKMVSTAKDDFETSTRDVVADAKSRLGEMETSAADDQPATDSSKNVTQAAGIAAAAVSSGSADADEQPNEVETSPQFETLDGQTLSADTADKDSDVGRTGS